MKTQTFSTPLLTALIGALLATIASAPSRALDTDIYLKSQSLTARDDSPNVMIILDNSGSMDEEVFSPPNYNPLIDYCTADLNSLYPDASDPNSTKPDNCAGISGRVFWGFSGSVPSTTSSQWFDESKNKCVSSFGALDNNNANDAGFYSGTKIARWNTGANWSTLNNQTDASILYVDCQADGNNNGLSAGNNNRPRSTTSIDPPYVNSSSNAFNWSNFSSNASPTLYSANYLNYRNNANLNTPVTRMDVAKGAVTGFVNSTTTVRLGLSVFNRNVNDNNGTNQSADHGGRVVFKVDNMDDARRLSMTNLVNGIVPSTNTPLSETLWEIYRYFGGLSVDYGDNDTSHAPSRDLTAQSGSTYISPFQYACQKAYVIYVTDGDPTRDQAADSKIETRIGATCDNMPNGSGGRTSTKSCVDDLAGWMNSNDVYTGIAGTQTVSTFTVGFGTGISASGRALLQETASQGGGRYYTAENSADLADALQNALAAILEETSSFTAPSLSINAFNRQYNRDEVYLSVFKPSSSCAWDGNLKKYRLCKQEDIDANRCASLGEVLDQDNNKITDAFNNIINTARSFWSTNADGSDVDRGGAGANIPAAASRNLYTYVGSYAGLSSTSPSTGVPIAVDASNAFYTAVSADKTLLGLPAAATATQLNTLISWMRGQDSYDKNLNANTTEARWSFGDPLHSRAVPVTYGGTEADPIIKLFVGANDGTIRMVNNDTGVEEWAFIPQELYGIQYNLSQDADGEHLYGMDNTPSFWIRDINKDGIINPTAGDRIYMYMSMRRGGRNIYAFDVTPTSTLTNTSQSFTPRLMWVIQGGTGDFAQLGETWSFPRIARIRYASPCGSVCDDGNPNTYDGNSRVVLMFAGGYNTNQDNVVPSGASDTGGVDSVGNAIYIVNPLTGARIWWASSVAGATLQLAKMRFSIPSELMLLDTDGDGHTDRLYVGDMGGQIWRIDLGANLAANANGGTAGYVFADVGCGPGNLHTNTGACSAGGVAQQRRKFFYPPEVAFVRDAAFSSSPNYDLVAIGSGNREDPLDILTSNLANPTSKEAVHNRIYAFRDYNIATGSPGSPTALTESNLYDATANLLATATGAALEAQISALKASSGWYIDLKNSSAIAVPNGLTTQWVGEKVLARIAIFGGKMYVTTFTPANDTNSVTTCDANAGVAMQYVLNALNALGAGDFDDDGVADERSGQVGGGIPSEVVIIFRPDGDIGVINAGGKGGAPIEAEGISSRNVAPVYWYEE